MTNLSRSSLATDLRIMFDLVASEDKCNIDLSTLGHLSFIVGSKIFLIKFLDIFVRKIINENLIPEDVSIQALTQARPELIKRTFEALEGVPRAIVHVYNSTSTLQRRVVFKSDEEGIKKIAIDGAKEVKEYSEKYSSTDWMFEYSPESFTGTELPYAVDVCNAVNEIWEPSKKKKTIIISESLLVFSLSSFLPKAFSYDIYISSLSPKPPTGRSILLNLQLLTQIQDKSS